MTRVAIRANPHEHGPGDRQPADAINLRRRQRVADLAEELLGGTVNQRRIAVLGVTFKPESDDVRDSPALDVAVQLKGLGAHVVATDPHGIENARGRHPQLDYVADTAEALRDANSTCSSPNGASTASDPAATAALVASPVVIDGRNALDAEAWRAAGWRYQGLGRP